MLLLFVHVWRHLVNAIAIAIINTIFIFQSQFKTGPEHTARLVFGKKSSSFYPSIGWCCCCFEYIGIFCASANHLPIAMLTMQLKIRTYLHRQMYMYKYKHINTSIYPANECIIDHMLINHRIIKPYLFYFYCSVLTLWPNRRKTNYILSIFCSFSLSVCVVCICMHVCTYVWCSSQ